MAATVEGVFRIVDRATPTLTKIEAKTKSLERSLQKAGKQMDQFAAKAQKDMKAAETSVNKFTRSSEKMSTKVKASMTNMSKSISSSTSKGQRDFEKLQATMASIDAQRVNPNIDVDIAKAMAQIMLLKKELQSLNAMEVSPGISTPGGFKKSFGKGGAVTEGLDETTDAGEKTIGMFQRLGDTMKNMGRKLLTGGGFIMRTVRVLLALSPALEAALAGIMAITASLSSGLMGGLVGGGAVIGTGAVGGLGALGAIIPVAKDIGESSEALKKYTEAIKEHGRASKEAAEARKAFRATDETARTIVGRWRNFTRQFESETEPGRRAVSQSLDAGIAVLNRRFRPTITEAVNRGGEGFQSIIGSLADTLDSPTVFRNMDIITKTFTSISPQIGQVFGDFTAMLTNITAAAKPQVIEFFQWLSEWMSSANNSTSNLAKLGQTFDRWTGDFKVWMGFFAEFGRFFTTLFSAGRQQGTDMIRDLTEEMEAQRRVWETPMGQQGLDNWYDRQVSNFRKLTREISALVGSLGSFIDLLSRALGPVLDLSEAIRKIVPGNSILDSLASIATIAALFSGAKAVGGMAIGAAASGIGGLFGGAAAGAGAGAGTGAKKFGGIKGIARAGGVGLGLLTLVDLLGANPDTQGQDTIGALQSIQAAGNDGIDDSVIRSLGLPTSDFYGNPTALSGDVVNSDIATQMLSEIEKIQGADNKRLRAIRRNLKARADELDLTRKQRKELDAMVNSQKTANIQGKMADLQGARGVMLRDLMGEGMSRADALKKVNQRYRQDTIGMITQLNPEDPQQRSVAEELAKPYKNNESVISAVEKRFDKMGKNVKIINGQIATGTIREWSAIYKAISTKTEAARQKAEDGFTKIQQAAFRSLQAMGLSPKEAASFIQANDAAGVRTQTPARPRSDGSPGSTGVGGPNPGRKDRAKGGRIPGRGLQDTVHMGENHWAAPGEMWIANRHTERRIDSMLSPYNTSLSREINREGKPHSAPMEHQLGGLIKFNRGGRRRRRGGTTPPTGSYPDAMGALPGLDVLAYYLKSKFGLSVTSGLRQGATTTTGNVSDHSWGGAIDVSNGVTTPQMDAAHAWLEQVLGPSLKQMLYRTMVGGNHYDHIHVALNQPYAGSAGKMEEILSGQGGSVRVGPAGPGKPMRINLRSPRVGMKGAPGAIAQRSNDLLAAGLEASVNRKLRKRGRGRAMAGGATVRGKATYFGGGMMASGLNTDINPGIALNPNPGGPDPQSWNNAQTQGWLENRQRFMVRVGNKSAVLPVLDMGPAGWTGNAIDVNMAGVKKMGYTTGNFPSGTMATATMVGGYKNGGRFSVNRPSIFVAGEGNRQEDVIVKPANKGTAKRRGGGGGVQVHIANIENHREGDISKQVEKEFAKLGMALDTYTDEDETWT